jgi:hypothetical protein
MQASGSQESQGASGGSQDNVVPAFPKGWAILPRSSSTAYAQSTLKAILTSPAWPEQFFIVGDDAFANVDVLLTPWPGRGIGVAKDAFKYTLSRARQCIERAFGMMVRYSGAASKWTTSDGPSSSVCAPRCTTSA